MSVEEDELYLAYATQLRSEHQAVKQCLARIERQFQRCREGLGSKAGNDALISSLADLRAELAHHFAEEEAGGCLEEAVTHMPCLGRDEAELEHEDAKLLNLVDRLTDKLRSETKSAIEIEKEYRQFVERICAHEAAESQIVKESFGLDVD
jgi:hypothetical protein